MTDEYDFDGDGLDRWESDCGYDPEFAGICWHAGSEDCQFFCPFHSIYFPYAELKDETPAPDTPLDDLPF